MYHTEYAQSILHNIVTLPALCLYIWSLHQKVIHLIIYWISWEILIFINSLWLCWWTHNDNLYHSSVQINTLYSFKFYFSIFFIIWNCFRTSALMNQWTACFTHSDYIRISSRCWILQAINRLIQLYLE